MVPKNRLPCNCTTTAISPASLSTSRSSSRRLRLECAVRKSCLASSTMPRIWSRINNRIARQIPTAEAAINPLWATTTTVAMTIKSTRVARRNSSRKMPQSNMRNATTSRMPARAPMGTHAINLPSSTKAAITSTPSTTPDQYERPPLVKLTSVAPMVPAPGMPPAMNAAKLADPCASNSRFESWRRRISASSTTPVLSVSTESSTDKVSAETSTLLTSSGRIWNNDVARSVTASTKEPPASIGPITS